MTPWSLRLHRAVDLAALAHQGQLRKDPDRNTPYATHLFGTAYLLATYDFPEDVVIAGLLHDLIEDQPASAPDLEAFGPRVVELVLAVSEVKLDGEGHTVRWRDRRDAYVELLRTGDAEAKAIACADKTYNMESTILGRERGADMWKALHTTPAEEVRWMERVRAAIAEGWRHPLLDVFDDRLDRLRALAREAASA